MSEPSSQEDYAIVLAGGKSSRMGQDKALLKVRAETLLEVVYRSVKPLVSQSVLMLSQTLEIPGIIEKLPGQITVGRDSQIEQGPLQGIADAMNLLPATGHLVYVVSCDLPYLTTQWLAGLRETLLASANAEIVCSALDGYQNPLIAVYRYGIISKAKKLIAENKRSCLALLDDQIVISKVPTAEETSVIANINTPHEYQQVLAELSEKSH